MRGRTMLPGLCLSLALLVHPATSRAAATGDEPPKLLGPVGVQQLEAEPYVEWFRPGYEAYEPNPAILRALRAADREGLELTLFFGTWCGDSRREVPRMLKLLDEIGLGRERIDLVAVDAADGAYKRSPGGEERGLEIYRVPTLIVRRAGVELARIVEYPVLSLERDLLAILDGDDYEPSYRSYPVIRGWLREGLLGDENVSARGLADRLRDPLAGEGELAAAAKVLLDRGEVREALKLSQVACTLYRQSADCLARLADAQFRAGDPDGARESARRALRLPAAAEPVDELLELLERSTEN